MKWLLRHGIPIFTVWKYLVGGIYQRGDLKLKSVKISVQGPFKPPSVCRFPLSWYLPLSLLCAGLPPPVTPLWVQDPPQRVLPPLSRFRVQVPLSVQFYLPLSVQDPPLWVVPPLTPLCRFLSLWRSSTPPPPPPPPVCRIPIRG